MVYKKIQRHHVHLSADKATGTKVAERSGKPVILEIKTGEMLQQVINLSLT